MKFRVNWRFGSEEKIIKIDFQHGCKGDHPVFQIRMILAITDLEVTPIHSIKFRVNWPFSSGEEAPK